MKTILPLLLFLTVGMVHANTRHDIEIKKFKFTPAEITIEKGDSIRWTNKEKRQYHSVWFEQLGEPEPDYFFPDEFYERTFDETGDFPYRCGPHPKMTGIVHVTPSGDDAQASEDGKDESADKPKAARSKTTDLKKQESSRDISPTRREEILYILKHDCGSCHGMTLLGGLGPALTPEALEKLTEEQIAATITNGRPGTPMPPWKPFFTEPETVWLAQQLKQGMKQKTPEQKTQGQEIKENKE